MVFLAGPAQGEHPKGTFERLAYDVLAFFGGDTQPRCQQLLVEAVRSGGGIGAGPALQPQGQATGGGPGPGHEQFPALVHEAAFTEAGFADDRDHAPLARLRLPQGFSQQRNLGLSCHQWPAAGEAALAPGRAERARPGPAQVRSGNGADPGTTATSSEGTHSNSVSVAARVAGPTSTDPGRATRWSAAADPTTSPTAP